MQSFIINHWGTFLFGLLSLIVWTIGNATKKKVFVYIGIAFSILALLCYAGLIPFLH